jgi:hypothetical protein
LKFTSNRRFVLIDSLLTLLLQKVPRDASASVAVPRRFAPLQFGEGTWQADGPPGQEFDVAVRIPQSC